MDQPDERETATPGWRLPRILVESTAIFLSVLLAFLVEQWRDDMNERDEAEAILNLVRAELIQNREELESVIPMRAQMLSEYQVAITALRDEGVFPAQTPKFESPEITSIAYQLAADADAVTSVATEELLIIARAYEALQEVRRNDAFLTERNAQIRFNDGEQYLSGFIYYLNRAAINEPIAVDRVRDAIEMLDNR
ncbi:MAG: hypothetical protein AAGA33_08435 [Pseudomonadota bacterium]